MLRDDSAMNLSPRMFERFIMPYDARLLSTYGGGALHFCGRGDHYIRWAFEMPGLTAVNLSQPELNAMDVIYDNTAGKGIPVIGLLRRCRHSSARGRDLLRVTALLVRRRGMRAKDVQTYLRSLDGGWMDLEKTVDTFKSGSPEAEVRGIGAVSWMSTTAALKMALAGCNLFITHEPTYYDHHDDPRWTSVTRARGRSAPSSRRAGITIIRCHDLWDQVPKIGIPDAWGALGLGRSRWR